MDNSKAELVLTASDRFGATLAYQVRARTTLGVLSELVTTARQSLVLGAPFLSAEGLFRHEPLGPSIQSALQRGVSLDILGTGLGLSNQTVRNLCRGGKIRTYRPQPNIEDSSVLGSHAKFCIADRNRAYVGSANLTGSGLGNNLEMGFLVHGELAVQVYQVWVNLVASGYYVEVVP